MGISLLLENFDFAAKCDMVEFTVTRIPNTHTDGRAYRRAVKNVGVRFSSDSISLISEGEPGDTYVFSRIKGKCPGDLAERKLNDLVFFLDDRK